MPEVIPVTVLSGFLGSGKTTILNKALRSPHGRKIAVVVNEIGEVGVDGALLKGGERFVELDNGCLCCALNDDLVSTLGEIGDRGGIEQVLIETTGIADPLPIGHAVTRPQLGGRFRLDAIVTTVDCVNVELCMAQSREAALQIRRADYIFLTKGDLVDPRRRAEVRVLIETHNPQARILRADDPQSVALLLDAHVEGELQCFKPQNDLAADEDEVAVCTKNHRHDENCGGHDDRAVHGFRSVAVQTGERSTLKLAFQEFLEGLPRSIYRSKGIVKIEGESGRLIFHTVGGRVDFWHDPASREPGRVVLIGRDFPMQSMREEVESLFAKG